jgi:hypothetical protein
MCTDKIKTCHQCLEENDYKCKEHDKRDSAASPPTQQGGVSNSSDLLYAIKEIRSKIGDRSVGDNSIWVGRDYCRNEMLNDLDLLIKNNTGA